ncbi:hypothetical protein [Methanobrevibacter sp.]
MKDNKMSPLIGLLILTLAIYVMGFLGTKNTYITSKFVVVSLIISLLILFVLLLKKYDIITNYPIVYGTIGINNAILCAILNSIEIGKDLTQQAILLGVHIGMFFTIILVLEIRFRKKKFINNPKTKTTVNSTLITLLVGLSLFLSRYLLRYGIEIRVVGVFFLGFLANTMFYIFLIYERLRKEGTNQGNIN